MPPEDANFIESLRRSGVNAREVSPHEYNLPSVTNLYTELDQLRKLGAVEASVAGIGSAGTVTIDQDFDQLGKISDKTNFDLRDERRSTRQDILGEVPKGWAAQREHTNKTEDLLQFKFGDVSIALEGKPTHDIYDPDHFRARVRYLGERANQPSYTFRISEEGKAVFRVAVNFDGGVTILDPHVVDTYKDALTGEETKSTFSRATKTVQREKHVLVDVPLPLWELVAKIPLRQLIKGPRTTKETKGTGEMRDVEVHVDHNNELVGGPNKEIKLDPQRPNKFQLGRVLIDLMQEGTRALEGQAATLRGTRAQPSAPERVRAITPSSARAAAEPSLPRTQTSSSGSSADQSRGSRPDTEKKPDEKPDMTDRFAKLEID